MWSLAWGLVMLRIQMAVILAIPIIMTYNGKRSRSQKINKIMKYGFYIYYPLHLFIIGLIQYAL